MEDSEREGVYVWKTVRESVCMCGRQRKSEAENKREMWSTSNS